MEFQSESSFAPGAGETIIVVNDAKRDIGSLEALHWAIKHVVRPKDTVVFLGVLSQLRKKSSSSCLPFIGIPAVKLDYLIQGGTSPGLVEKEIKKKREEYQSKLQPFHKQCMKCEVNLEVKLVAGFSTREIIVEEAHNSNSRWIILDSHLRKEKVYIYGHVACNVAVMKRKGIATLMPSRDRECGKWLMESQGIEDFACTVNETEQLQYDESANARQDEELSPQASTPQCPYWHQLAQITGFPRAFSFTELEEITNGFSNENIIIEKDGCRIYNGILIKTPVLINHYPRGDDRFLQMLKLLPQLQHHNIVNLVGYCCTNYSMFILYDYLCSGLLERKLKDDECGKNFSWTSRWNIALEIGEALCYLQEECDADGPVVNISICSTGIALFHGSSAKIGLQNTARQYEDFIASNEDPSPRFPDIKEHLLADIRAYGMFLFEIITGKNQQYSEEQAASLLEDCSISKVIDQRLADTGDDGLAQNMVQGALLCLKSDLDHILAMSEILAVVRGDPVPRP